MEEGLLITADELRRISRQMEMAAGVVEKDYALTWILKGIYSEDSKLRDTMIFKGGTALGKIYYPEIWRLSEDLDFTILGDTSPDIIRASLQQVLDFLGTRSGLLFSFQSFHATPGSIISNVQFTGPLGGKNRIRHDITLKEKLVQNPEWRSVYTNYPDIGTFNVNVYSEKEILIEKIRSIIQRGKSRDYYDVWRMLREKEFNRKEVKDLLLKKCQINEIEYQPHLIFDESRLVEAETFWRKGLGYLTKELPEFRLVISELKSILEEFDL